MAGINGDERTIYIKDMFARIAHRYDLMNRMMTAGQDVHWRREVIRRAELPPGGFLLDLGAGTGDLANYKMSIQESVFHVSFQWCQEQKGFRCQVSGVRNDADQ